MRRWTEALLADVTLGLGQAEEQADDVDASDKGAVKQVQAVVASLRAAREALAEELERL